MLLAGRKLTAIEAFNCGLVSEVIPHDKFTDETQNKVQALGRLPPKVNIFLYFVARLIKFILYDKQS